MQIGLPPAELTAAAQNSSLQWRPGQNGTLNISLPLAAMGNTLQQGVLVLRLGNVTNADLSAEYQTTLISDLPQENLTVVLAMQPNQVESNFWLLLIGIWPLAQGVLQCRFCSFPLCNSTSECIVSSHPGAGEHLLGCMMGSVVRHVDLIPIYTAIPAIRLAIQLLSMHIAP